MESIDRRGFLRIGLAGMLSSCTGGIESEIEVVRVLTEADRELERFPLEISGAKKVEKYPVKGSSYCLTHIGQVHWVDGATKMHKDRVYRNQSDIYKIITSLNEEGYDTIYSEGGRSTQQEMLDRDLEKFRKVMEKLGERFKDPKYVERLGMIYYGAESLAALNIGINIRPGEDLDAWNRMKKAEEDYKAGKISEEEFDKINEDGREDGVLRLLSKDKLGSIFNLVYGRRHDWRNNIKEWNRKNPDRKFSHIVVTPEHY